MTSHDRPPPAPSCPAVDAVRWTVSPAGDPAWLATGYSLIKDLLSDSRLGMTHRDPESASRISRSVIFGRPERHTGRTDADHAFKRRLLGPTFSPRRMEALRPRVERLVDELRDSMISAGAPADAHEHLSYPLPALVMCELLGLPAADRRAFRDWCEDAADMEDQARSQRGVVGLFEYLGHTVADLVARAADADSDPETLLAALVRRHLESPDELGFNQVVELTVGLVFAGYETTMTAIDTAIVVLASEVGSCELLGREPGRIPGVVEEVMRLRTPAFGVPGSSQRAVSPQAAESGLPRWARTDLTVGGADISEGDLVMLDLHDANHDPRLVGDHPGFTPKRDRNTHLTFGHGPRYCLGAPLARLEVEAVIGSIVSGLPTLGLACGLDELSHRDTTLAGGLRSLPVRW